MDVFTQLLRETLGVTALLSLPVLIVATITGTVIALLQAVTQIQEQTLSVLPKFCFVGLLTVLGGRFAIGQLCTLFHHGIVSMPFIVRAQ
jgi:flagellar biosynthesis protein FliQ